MPPHEIHGHCDSAFSAVKDAFASNFQNDKEIGASFCVFHEGHKAVDIWAGQTAECDGQGWAEDTIVNVWSTTKGATAAAVAHAVNAGLLAYETPVAHYWPEFGSHGKQDITVAQLFSHQSGCCGLSSPITEDDMYDVDGVATLLADESPMWEPGTRSGYHAISIGYFADALFKRVAGVGTGEYFNTRIAEPLGIEFYMGLPASEDHRVAHIVHKGNRKEDLNKYETAAQRNIPIDYAMPNERRWREMGLPSAGGTANARGIAGMYGAILSDLRGETCLIASPEVLSQALACRIENTDLVLEMDLSWAAGFVLSGKINMYGPNPISFGHTGWGGSLGFADPDAALSVGYSMNCMREIHDGDDRALNLITALYTSLSA